MVVLVIIADLEPKSKSDHFGRIFDLPARGLDLDLDLDDQPIRALPPLRSGGGGSRRDSEGAT